MIRILAMSLISAINLAAQGWPAAPEPMFLQSDREAGGDPDYQRGMHDLDQRHWDRAISDFDASAGRNRSTRDAALYWKAYAQQHAGRTEQAFATVAELRTQFPSSRWLKDADALELEMRAQTGAPANPNTQSDEELKLLAINSLMQSDSREAVPVLEKVLRGNSSEKVKERALFVLTQSSSAEAHKLLEQVAHDSAHPDLQRKAIRYMGLTGNEQCREQLAAIYKSSSDPQIKRDILHSLMQSGSRDFLLDIARSERDPELRRDAIRQLAITGGTEQLHQLYNSETSLENKKTILNSAFMTGDSSWLEQIARTEHDPGLRLAAIKSLGLMGARGQSDVLVSIYRSDSTPEVRSAVLNALFLQQNGRALVELARTEKDPKWKQEIVQKMSLVHSKEVTDYMLEVLK